MARLNWGSMGDRFYESGVDRGVLYLPGEPGEPWIGLVSVDERLTGGEPRPLHLDGVKYSNLATMEEFAATVTAFASPLGFSRCDGVAALANGLFATQQARSPFGLSYRTMVGNEISNEVGYKIHLVYDAMAASSGRQYKTIGASSDVSPISWDVSTIPPITGLFRPTAHLVIDTRYTPKLLVAAVEAILYGDDSSEARLPSQEEIVALFNSAGPLVERNLSTDPAATSVGNRPAEFRWARRWFGMAGGSGTEVLVKDATDGPEGLTSYLRKIWKVAGGVMETGFDHTMPNYSGGALGTTGFPVTEGATHTFSSYMRASTVLAGTTFAMRATFRDATGARILPIPFSQTVTPTAGQWDRVSLTATAPVGATTVTLGSDVFGNGTWPVDATLDGTGLLVTKTAELGPYADGNTPGYVWDGPPNNSTSSRYSWGD